MSNIQQTSIDAYRDIKKNLGARQQTVYNAIKKLGDVTNLEISTHLRIPINQIVPRVFELREKGFVSECQKRECSISGRTVWSWRVI